MEVGNDDIGMEAVEVSDIETSARDISEGPMMPMAKRSRNRSLLDFNFVKTKPTVPQRGASSNFCGRGKMEKYRNGGCGQRKLLRTRLTSEMFSVR